MCIRWEHYLLVSVISEQFPTLSSHAIVQLITKTITTNILASIRKKYLRTIINRHPTRSISIFTQNSSEQFELKSEMSDWFYRLHQLIFTLQIEGFAGQTWAKIAICRRVKWSVACSGSLFSRNFTLGIAEIYRCISQFAFFCFVLVY